MPLTHMNRPAQEADELLALESRMQAQTALKANKTQEAWITPTLLNSWVIDSGCNIQYYKDEFGNVKVRGRAKSGTLGTVVFQLPIGYRPSQIMSFPGICSGTVLGGIVVDTSGTITLWNGNNTYFSLDSISFRV